MRFVCESPFGRLKAGDEPVRYAADETAVRAVTAFFAPIPIVGTGVVWVPTAVGLLVSGAPDKALAVALWSVLIVGTVDNFLRPILIGAEAKLPILLLFFGMLGGLQVYGFAGIIVGPVIVALFLALADIYRREYRWLLAPQKEDS